MKETQKHKSHSDIEAIFEPIFADILERVDVAQRFIDKPNYQILMTTLWANVVLNPEDADLNEHDLESLHTIVNDEIARVLGAGYDITECFRFINTKVGERAMTEAKLTKTHKDMLLYFSSMILDPQGHAKWMEEIRNPRES